MRGTILMATNVPNRPKTFTVVVQKGQYWFDSLCGEQITAKGIKEAIEGWNCGAECEGRDIDVLEVSDAAPTIGEDNGPENVALLGGP